MWRATRDVSKRGIRIGFRYADVARTIAYRLRVMSTVKVNVKKKSHTVKIGGNFDVIMVGAVASTPP